MPILNITIQVEDESAVDIIRSLVVASAESAVKELDTATDPEESVTYEVNDD